MIKWAGRLIVFYGVAHTLGALFVLGAADHAGAWFSGDLWDEDFADPTAAGSALWLSLESFGVPLAVVGSLIIWMDRHAITPPTFLAWFLAVYTLADAVILLTTPWPIPLIATALLFAGIRRAEREAAAAPETVAA